MRHHVGDLSVRKHDDALVHEESSKSMKDGSSQRFGEDIRELMRSPDVNELDLV